MNRARPNAAPRPTTTPTIASRMPWSTTMFFDLRRLARRAPGGCRSPASAARPSTPSGRRCRSPRAAAPRAPNTVISHMLKRWREVDRDTTSLHRPDVGDRQAGRLAQLLLDRRAQRDAARPRVRTTHAIGVRRTLSALAASGTCACGMYIVGPRIVVQAAVADVADDADDLALGLVGELAHDAAADDRAARSADRPSARTAWPSPR